VEAFDTCYVHLGRLDFTRKWLEKDVSKRLTGAVVLGILLLGMVIGFTGALLVGGGECYLSEWRMSRLERIMFDIGT
jgi:hypothetical protein